MSSGAPAPPPPPPSVPPGLIPSPSNSASKSPAKMQQATSSKQINKNFEEQLKDAAWFAKVDRDRRLVIVAKKPHANGQLQDGPMCGLVAFSMASEALLGHSGLVKVSDALENARAAGYSNHGEMFSAGFMSDLCRNLLPWDDTLVSVEELSATALNEAAASGTLLLVPYDVDKNQTPCLKRGKKAHWCLVLGEVFEVEKESEQVPANSTELDRGLWLAPEDVGADWIRGKTSRYALVRQSKSRRLFLYDPKALLESNANLITFTKEDDEQGREFVIPKEGIDKELRGKAVKLTVLK